MTKHTTAVKLNTTVSVGVCMEKYVYTLINTFFPGVFSLLVKFGNRKTPT